MSVNQLFQEAAHEDREIIRGATPERDIKSGGRDVPPPPGGSQRSFVQDSAIDHPCPKCGRELRERENRRTGQKFIGCTGYPDCYHTEKVT